MKGPFNRPDEALLKLFTFSYYTTMAIIVSFFPIYFDALGYNKMQIGLISSAGPMVAIFSNLLWGLVSDRLQTIKKTIIALLCGQLLMVLLLNRFSAYAVVYTFMTAFYFFQTPMSGLNDSQIMLKIRQNGQSYASFRVFGSLGFACSALAFGLFLKHQPAHAIAGLTVCTVASSLLLALTLKDARGEKGKFVKMDFSGFSRVFFSSRLLIFLLLVLIISTAHRTNDMFLALYLMDMGAGKDTIGLAWMTSALSEVPIFFLLSRYGDRYRELPLLAAASAFYALRFALISMVRSPEAIIATQLMHSVTFGIFLFTALRYLQKLVPDRFRATGQAAFNMIWGGMAGVLTGLLGGILYDRFGGVMLYRFAAITAFTACAGFVLASLAGRTAANTGAAAES